MTASSLGLGAHDSLLGQRNSARGVCLLMFKIGLRLRKRGLRDAHLGFGIGRGAGDFALILALGFDCLAELGPVAGNGGLGSFVARRQDRHSR